MTDQIAQPDDAGPDTGRPDNDEPDIERPDNAGTNCIATLLDMLLSE